MKKSASSASKPESMIHVPGLIGTINIPFNLDYPADAKGWAQAQKVIMTLYKSKKPLPKEEAVFKALGTRRFTSNGGRIFQADRGYSCWLVTKTYGKSWEKLWTLSGTGEQFARCLKQSLGRQAEEAMHTA